MKIKNCKDIELNTITALIVGESATGKTTMLSTLPPKTLIVSMEKGLLSIRGKDVDYVEVEGADGIQKVGWLRQTLSEIAKTDYDNIAIDSLSDISENLLEYAKNEYPDDKQTMKMFGFYNLLMQRFIKSCRDLDKNVFFTALVKTEKDDLGRRFKLPAVTGAIAEKGLAHFDFVFHLIVLEKDGEKKRAVLTDTQDGMICKDRSGKLDTWEAPDLTNIINKINGEKHLEKQA